MAMKTLKEIDDAEVALRDRARLYQTLIEERDTLSRAVDLLEPKITVATKALDALKQIHAVSNSGAVPDTLTTRGSLFVNGGFKVAEVLVTTAANAIKDQEIRRADLEVTLQKVRDRQVVNAERLKTEFSE